MNASDRDADLQDPPSPDTLAGEYVLGVLDAAERERVRGRIAADPGFARRVAQWEAHLAPLLAELGEEAVPAHVWPRLRTRLGWSPVARTRLWQRTGFWQATTAAAAVFALVALLAGREHGVTPPVSPPAVASAASHPVTPLRDDAGAAAWVASIDAGAGELQVVPVPAPADAQGRVPELWLIPAGGTPRSLGVVSRERTQAVAVPTSLRDQLRRGALLAITLEPPGGAPQGVPTGPIIAKGEIVSL
jgi:anti-sigma-K factor RskA